jgi:hypothetical protein
MAGRSLLVKKYAHQGIINIDTKSLTNGVYFLRLTADGQHASFKIVK